MNIFFALLILFMPIAAPPAPPADEVRITSIQRTVVADKVYIVALLEAKHEMQVTAGKDYVTSRAQVQDRTDWRLTVNATLPLCSGALAVDGQLVTSQRCVYLPQGVK